MKLDRKLMVLIPDCLNYVKYSEIISKLTQKLHKTEDFQGCNILRIPKFGDFQNKIVSPKASILFYNVKISA